jgi:hypothetical protein
MIPYLARLLDVTVNNATIPSDWKKAIVFPVYKGGDRSLVTNYTPVSLTSVVYKQMEHVIALYLRKIWDIDSGWDIHVKVTVCQDIADSLDNRYRIDAIVIDFLKAFSLVPHDRLLMKIAASEVDSRIVVWIREFLSGRTQRVRVGGQLSESGVPQGSVLGSLLFLAYVYDIWRNIQSTIRLFVDDYIIN